MRLKALKNLQFFQFFLKRQFKECFILFVASAESKWKNIYMEKPFSLKRKNTSKAEKRIKVCFNLFKRFSALNEDKTRID